MFWGTVAEIVPTSLLFVSLCGYPFWGDHRYRQGRFDRGLDRVELQLKQGRHRADRTGLVRQQPPAPETAAAAPQGNRWYQDIPRNATVATDLGPVHIPGPGRPQAGRDSMDGTLAGGMPKVTTDTGEFRAATTEAMDAYIEDMERSEAAFRGEMLA